MLLCIAFCTPKVDQLDYTLLCDHDVGSLDVTMNDPVVVQIVDTLYNLSCVMTYGTLIQRPKPDEEQEWNFST